MPKKVKFESAVYSILAAANRFQSEDIVDGISWLQFIDLLEFEYQKDVVCIRFKGRSLEVELNKFKFYTKYSDNFKGSDTNIDFDQIKLSNYQYSDEIVRRIAEAMNYRSIGSKDKDRFDAERDFHDDWADNASPDLIDVVKVNEAITSPELRYIFSKLGDLKGKSVLDLGCGLGEVSVYFALKGADVTASDISPRMLEFTHALSMRYNVGLQTHLSTAENLQLGEKQFDIIYAGNLLHHVNIKETLDVLLPHLKEGGRFVSWDPLAYNPAINNYRKIASDVRTIDEHPLTRSDVAEISKRFSSVNLQFYWLSTLIIFIYMALVQRRDPNRERYWKVVIDESDKWAPIYKPLEFFDRILIKIFPFLKWYSWNVVIIGNK